MNTLLKYLEEERDRVLASLAHWEAQRDAVEPNSRDWWVYQEQIVHYQKALHSLEWQINALCYAS